MVILRGLKKSVREECGWEGYKRNRSIQCRRCAAFTRAKGASEWSGVGPLCNAMHNFMVKMKKGKKEEERRRKGGKEERRCGRVLLTGSVSPTATYQPLCQAHEVLCLAAVLPLQLQLSS